MAREKDFLMFFVIPKERDEMISANISHKEFRCKCDSEYCNFTIFNSQLLFCFERLRKLAGHPIKITSGYRCTLHNSRIEQSAKRSMHCAGSALDMIAPDQYSIETFAGMARQAGFDYVKIYPDDRRIHAHLELK
jgi:uncharacterized protein YcbK (DUF882 family)